MLKTAVPNTKSNCNSHNQQQGANTQHFFMKQYVWGSDFPDDAQTLGRSHIFFLFFLLHSTRKNTERKTYTAPDWCQPIQKLVKARLWNNGGPFCKKSYKHHHISCTMVGSKLHEHKKLLDPCGQVVVMALAVAVNTHMPAHPNCIHAHVQSTTTRYNIDDLQNTTRTSKSQHITLTQR